MSTLVSPGVSVTVTADPYSSPASIGTVPLFVIATASNKASVGGTGIAPFTEPGTAGQLYLATGQGDLLRGFGAPIFYSVQGTPLHGYELNEYGLHAAWSYLGLNNRAYVLRADLDLAELQPTASPPVGPPVAGTYWLNTAATQWGLFQANGNVLPGSAWSPMPVLTPASGDLTSNIPNSGYGTDGAFAVVTETANNKFYQKIGGSWFEIGTSGWVGQFPTTVTGAANPPVLTINNAISINTTTVTFASVSGNAVSDAVTAINTAAIANIVASASGSGALIIENTAGGSIVLANVVGTPLATLGLTAGTTVGVQVFRTASNDPSYPSGVTAGALWIKGNTANKGANWSVNYYNAGTGQWVAMTAPFYAFDSTLSDGTSGKDAAAIAVLGTPTTGNVYVGFDNTTGAQQLRRWNGTQWAALTYEAEAVAPSSPPPAGTHWFNSDFAVDIMVSTGSQWHAYRRYYPSTDANGVQLSATMPLTQSGGGALVDNDLWIDTSDSEDYPLLYRFVSSTNTWTRVDPTDQTTPFGVLFADARVDSGPTFTGIANAGAYTYSSTLATDMALSDYLDPDAPDPRLYPAGMLLFNTRYSTNNVKRWAPNWFNTGGFSPTVDYTVTPYHVGSAAYTFPALASPARWITASGNRQDGAPNMGRKAQRAMVVQALSAVMLSNEDMLSELVQYNLMAAPGYVEVLPDLVQVNTAMNNTAFIVADAPIRLAASGTAIQAWALNSANAPTDGDSALVTASDYTAVYYPWGLGTNVDGSEIAIPPSTIAMVTLAYNDQVAYPWFAPAGFQRGLVSNATTVGYLDSTTGDFNSVILNQGQRDVLYVNKINPIAFIPGRGLVIYGQKTLAPVASELDRVNVARLINYINTTLDVILKPLLFEQNDTITRKAARSIVESFFNSLVGLRGLYDYAVVCDTTNNTPDRVAAEELWIDAAIQPINAVEFIYVPVRVQQLGTQLAPIATQVTGAT